MPQIIPVRELKNAANVARICQESGEPVFVTRNGCGEMVCMSIALYDRMKTEMELAGELARAYGSNARPIDAGEAFQALKEKYAPK